MPPGGTDRTSTKAPGAGLAAFIRRQYGEFGFDANHEASVSFDALAAEIGPYPMLIGGHNWGGPHKGHWSALRGYDAARGVLLLANPGGTGPTYGGQEMTRNQFQQRGGSAWWSVAPESARVRSTAGPRQR